MFAPRMVAGRFALRILTPNLRPIAFLRAREPAERRGFFAGASECNYVFARIFKRLSEV
jgi:hypothetical protein